VADARHFVRCEVSTLTECFWEEAAEARGRRWLEGTHKEGRWELGKSADDRVRSQDEHERTPWWATGDLDGIYRPFFWVYFCLKMVVIFFLKKYVLVF
jgi:hypothetical protein